MDYRILNRDVKFKNPQLVLSNSKGSINDVPKDIVDNLQNHFNELYINGKDNYSLSDLEEAHKVIKERHVAKMRVLRKEEEKGFVITSLLTIIGIITLGFIIFTTISNIMGR